MTTLQDLLMLSQSEAIAAYRKLSTDERDSLTRDITDDQSAARLSELVRDFWADFAPIKASEAGLFRFDRIGLDKGKLR